MRPGGAAASLHLVLRACRGRHRPYHPNVCVLEGGLLCDLLGAGAGAPAGPAACEWDTMPSCGERTVRALLGCVKATRDGGERRRRLERARGGGGVVGGLWGLQTG